MRIGSILIGGIERVSSVLLREMSITFDSGDRMGACRFLILANPDLEPTLGSMVLGEATIGISIVPGQTVEIYSVNEDQSSGGLFGDAVFGEPLFGIGEATVPLFAGQITYTEPKVMVARRLTSAASSSLWGDVEFGGPLFGEAPGVESVNIISVECRDWNSILENTIVESADYTNTTDLAVIQNLFSTYAPSVDIAGVASLCTLPAFPVREESLRSVVDRLSERSGSVYYIDPTKALHYFAPSSQPAAFSFSEDPDNTTSFAFDRETFRLTYEWRAPANSVTVVGSLETGGTNLRVTETNASSVAAYGTFGATVVDRQITSAAEASLRARVELERRAYPLVAGTLTCRTDGLSVGQLVTIEAPGLKLNGAYVIRRLTAKWLNRSITQWEVEFGTYQPDLARYIRRLQDMAKPPGSPPVAVPAPGSVSQVSLASTIEPVTPVTSLPSLPSASWSDNAIVLLTTDRKLYRRNVNTWTAVVPTSDLTGQITAAMNLLAADSVVAGTIAAGAIRAADAVFETGAIQSADIGNAVITTAKIGDLQVTSLKIGNEQVLTGNIGPAAVTNEKVASISASKITTDDLLVGGSGHAGQVTVLDGSNNGIGWIGKNGTNYGIWAGQLYVGGTGPANARLTCLNGGAMSLSLADGDSFMLTSTTNSRKTIIDNSSVRVEASASSTTYGGMIHTTVFVTNASGPAASIFCDSATAVVTAYYSTSQKVILNAAASGTGVQINGTLVIAPTKTGWTLASGTATRSGFTTSTVTLSVLAEHVKALMDDLATYHALIGT